MERQESFSNISDMTDLTLSDLEEIEDQGPMDGDLIRSLAKMNFFGALNSTTNNPGTVGLMGNPVTKLDEGTVDVDTKSSCSSYVHVELQKNEHENENINPEKYGHEVDNTSLNRSEALRKTGLNSFVINWINESQLEYSLETNDVDIIRKPLHRQETTESDSSTLVIDEVLIHDNLSDDLSVCVDAHNTTLIAEADAMEHSTEDVASTTINDFERSNDSLIDMNVKANVDVTLKKSIEASGKADNQPNNKMTDMQLHDGGVNIRQEQHLDISAPINILQGISTVKSPTVDNNTAPVLIGKSLMVEENIIELKILPSEKSIHAFDDNVDIEVSEEVTKELPKELQERETVAISDEQKIPTTGEVWVENAEKERNKDFEFDKPNVENYTTNHKLNENMETDTYQLQTSDSATIERFEKADGEGENENKVDIVEFTLLEASAHQCHSQEEAFIATNSTKIEADNMETKDHFKDTKERESYSEDQRNLTSDIDMRDDIARHGEDEPGMNYLIDSMNIHHEPEKPAEQNETKFDEKITVRNGEKEKNVSDHENTIDQVQQEKMVYVKIHSKATELVHSVIEDLESAATDIGGERSQDMGTGQYLNEKLESDLLDDTVTDTYENTDLDGQIQIIENKEAVETKINHVESQIIENTSLQERCHEEENEKEPERKCRHQESVETEISSEQPQRTEEELFERERQVSERQEESVFVDDSNNNNCNEREQLKHQVSVEINQDLIVVAIEEVSLKDDEQESELKDGNTTDFSKRKVVLEQGDRSNHESTFVPTDVTANFNKTENSNQQEVNNHCQELADGDLQPSMITDYVSLVVEPQEVAKQPDTTDRADTKGMQKESINQPEPTGVETNDAKQSSVMFEEEVLPPQKPKQPDSTAEERKIVLPEESTNRHDPAGVETSNAIKESFTVFEDQESGLKIDETDEEAGVKISQEKGVSKQEITENEMEIPITEEMLECDLQEMETIENDGTQEERTKQPDSQGVETNSAEESSPVYEEQILALHKQKESDATAKQGGKVLQEESTNHHDPTSVETSNAIKESFTVFKDQESGLKINETDEEAGVKMYPERRDWEITENEVEIPVTKGCDFQEMENIENDHTRKLDDQLEDKDDQKSVEKEISLTLTPDADKIVQTGDKLSFVAPEDVNPRNESNSQENSGETGTKETDLKPTKAIEAALVEQQKIKDLLEREKLHESNEEARLKELQEECSFHNNLVEMEFDQNLPQIIDGSFANQEQTKDMYCLTGEESKNIEETTELQENNNCSPVSVVTVSDEEQVKETEKSSPNVTTQERADVEDVGDDPNEKHDFIEQDESEKCKDLALKTVEEKVQAIDGVSLLCANLESNLPVIADHLTEGDKVLEFHEKHSDHKQLDHLRTIHIEPKPTKEVTPTDDVQVLYSTEQEYANNGDNGTFEFAESQDEMTNHIKFVEENIFNSNQLETSEELIFQGEKKDTEIQEEPDVKSDEIGDDNMQDQEEPVEMTRNLEQSKVDEEVALVEEKQVLNLQEEEGSMDHFNDKIKQKGASDDKEEDTEVENNLENVKIIEDRVPKDKKKESSLQDELGENSKGDEYFGNADNVNNHHGSADGETCDKLSNLTGRESPLNEKQEFVLQQKLCDVVGATDQKEDINTRESLHDHANYLDTEVTDEVPNVNTTAELLSLEHEQGIDLHTEVRIIIEKNKDVKDDNPDIKELLLTMDVNVDRAVGFDIHKDETDLLTTVNSHDTKTDDLTSKSIKNYAEFSIIKESMKPENCSPVESQVYTEFDAIELCDTNVKPDFFNDGKDKQQCQVSSGKKNSEEFDQTVPQSESSIGLLQETFDPSENFKIQENHVQLSEESFTNECDDEADMIVGSNNIESIAPPAIDRSEGCQVENACEADAIKLDDTTDHQKVFTELERAPKESFHESPDEVQYIQHEVTTSYKVCYPNSKSEVEYKDNAATDDQNDEESIEESSADTVIEVLSLENDDFVKDDGVSSTDHIVSTPDEKEIQVNNTETELENDVSRLGDFQEKSENQHSSTESNSDKNTFSDDEVDVYSQIMEDILESSNENEIIESTPLMQIDKENENRFTGNFIDSDSCQSDVNAVDVNAVDDNAVDDNAVDDNAVDDKDGDCNVSHDSMKDNTLEDKEFDSSSLQDSSEESTTSVKCSDAVDINVANHNKLDVNSNAPDTEDQHLTIDSEKRKNVSTNSSPNKAKKSGKRRHLICLFWGCGRKRKNDSSKSVQN